MNGPPTLFPPALPRKQLPPAATGCCSSRSCLSCVPTLISRIYFSWGTALLLLGFHKELSPSDLYATNKLDSTKFCTFKLKEALHHAVAAGKPRPSLCWAYMRAFGRPFWMAAICRPIWLCFNIIQIFSLRQILVFVSNNGRTGSSDEQTMWAVLSIAGFCLGALCQPLLINHMFIWSLRVGLRARAATTGLIWERLSTMRSSELNSQRGATIMNLAEVDTMRIVEGFRYGHFAWVGILIEIPAVTIFLLLEAGPAALLGVFVLILAIPLQAYFARRIGRIQSKAVKKTDRRARLMQEILTGVEMVKVNAWEENFSRAVNAAREEEVSNLRSSEVYKSLNQCVFQAAPLLAACCVFCIKALAYQEPLTSSSTFATLAWFNLIFRTLIMVPRGVSHLVEARVSAERIEKFLFTERSSVLVPLQRAAEDIPTAVISKKESDKKIIVKCCDCSWTWSATTDDTLSPCLQHVTFELREKETMCVVGEIGSGKTSLLCALQNDLRLISSESFQMSSDLRRTLYIPQEPYVVSCSLWENVTFGLPFELDKFTRVMRACA